MSSCCVAEGGVGGLGTGCSSLLPRTLSKPPGAATALPSPIPAQGGRSGVGTDCEQVLGGVGGLRGPLGYSISTTRRSDCAPVTCTSTEGQYVGQDRWRVVRGGGRVNTELNIRPQAVLLGPQPPHPCPHLDAALLPLASAVNPARPPCDAVVQQHAEAHRCHQQPCGQVWGYVVCVKRCEMHAL